MASKKSILNKDSQSGESLITVLIAVAILGILVIQFAQMINTSSRAGKRTELRNDLVWIASLLRENIDCDATFSNAGIDPKNIAATQCTSTSASGGQSSNTEWLRLYRRTASGASELTSSWTATTGVQKVGAWSLRVSCSKTEETLVVRGARQDSSGGFLKDPLTGKAQDWDAVGALVAGGWDNGIPLCQNLFITTGSTFVDVGLNADFALPGVTPTQIRFDKVNEDTLSEYDTTNLYFRAKNAGLYQVHVSLSVASQPWPVTNGRLVLYKNANPVFVTGEGLGTPNIPPNPHPSTAMQLTGATIVKLSKNDVLSLFYESDEYPSGTVLSAFPGTHLRITRIR